MNQESMAQNWRLLYFHSDQLFHEEYEDSEDESDDDVILDMDLLMNTPRRKRGAA